MRALVMLLLGACGRFGFDPIATGSGDAIDPDAFDPDALDPDLVLWYPLDELAPGARDASGHGHDATCVTTCPIVVPGKRGNAVQLDGVADVLATPNAVDLHLAEGTIAFWASVTPSSNGHFIAKPQGGNTSDTWELRVTNSQAIMGGDSNGSSYVMTIMPTGTWVHLAMTWAGGLLAIHVNGAQQASMAGFNPLYDGHLLFVGADQNTGVNMSFVDGELDDIRVYRRALTAGELASLASP